MSPVPLDLTVGIVRILYPSGSTAGTGFIVHRDGIIVTCAHVVQDCGAGPGDTVRLAFHTTGEEREATVERNWWRDPKAEDVAILRLHGPLPEGVEPLPLGLAQHSRGHDFSSWGYRLAEVFPSGLAAEGKIQGRTRRRNQDVLQLQTSQIDRGMSGAPLWDVQGGRVVGMVNSFWETRRHQDALLAFAIPTETLRAVCPLLQLSDLCPYRGLEPFTEADAEFFFGRERAVEHLLEHLRQEPRFLAVLGPSGSGKSSLVQAGLIPRLCRGAVPRSDRWAFIPPIRPGRNPFGELEAAGLSGASQGLVEAVQNWQNLHPEAERLALMLDQFEEFLVDCPEETCREFVAQLVALLDSPLPVTVILVMRDDFYSRFAREARPLVKWLERGLANVPLTLEPEEVRAIVEKPAQAVGLDLEKGLADIIVRDVTEAAPQGVSGTILPLLEFALTGLWERREEGLLTHAAYQAVGGVTGGLTHWADGVLSRLDKEQSQLARRVLTDLVHLGDESRNIPDSRRRRTLDELCRHEEKREAVHEVVRLLADARLLSTGRDLSTGQETVELIHDALLREWGQLREWLQDDRRFLAWRQVLERRVWEWQDKERDEGALLDGALLKEAQDWPERRLAEIEDEAQEFIRLSVEKAEAERRARERLRRRITLGLAAGLAVATLLALLAFWQADVARRERDVARARQWAAVGQDALERLRGEQGVILGLALGVESMRLAPSLQADQLLREGLGRMAREVARMTHEGGVVAVAFSPDGRYVVSGSGDGTARVWEAVSGREVARMMHGGDVTSVAFSPEGRYVVSGSDYKTARVWLWRPEDLIEEACHRLPRNLTLEEWQQYVAAEVPYHATCPDKPIPEETPKALESRETQYGALSQGWTLVAGVLILFISALGMVWLGRRRRISVRVRWLYGAALCGFIVLIAAWQAWNAWRALTPFLMDALGLALLAVLSAVLARFSLRASPPGRWSLLLAWPALVLGGYMLAVYALVALRGELHGLPGASWVWQGWAWLEFPVYALRNLPLSWPDFASLWLRWLVAALVVLLLGWCLAQAAESLRWAVGRLRKRGASRG